MSLQFLGPAAMTDGVSPSGGGGNFCSYPPTPVQDPMITQVTVLEECPSLPVPFPHAYDDDNDESDMMTRSACSILVGRGENAHLSHFCPPLLPPPHTYPTAQFGCEKARLRPCWFGMGAGTDDLGLFQFRNCLS